MATFNTAFGSLPSPKKDLFGNAPMGGDDDDDYTKGFAPGSTTEKTAAAPPPTNTFADLQKQGVARPAPRDTSSVSPEFDAAAMPPMLSQLQERLPEAAPDQADAAPMAGPQAVPMLGQLQQSLSGMAAPDAGEIVLGDGAGGSGGIGNAGGGGGGGAAGGGTPPPPPPPPPPTMGYSATGGITGTPTIDKDTNTATYTNVEVPVSNAPQYKAGTVPPPTAPNGSTFVSGSGVTWTKRGGVWGAEARAGVAMPTGYAALTPPELAAQTQANLPSGAAGFGGTLSSEPGQGSGLYQFLRKYGTPTSEAEFATLAQQAGKTVEQLKSYIASQPANTNFGTKRDVDTNAEEQAWKKENKVDFVPYNYAYVPASEGGPRLRKKSYEEMVAAGYQPYGGKALYDSPANDLALARSNGTVNLLRTFGGLAGGVSNPGGAGPGGPAEGGPELTDSNQPLPPRDKPPIPILPPPTGGGTPGTTGRTDLPPPNTGIRDTADIPSNIGKPVPPPTGGGTPETTGGAPTGGGTPATAATPPRVAYTPPPVAGGGAATPAAAAIPTYAGATEGAGQFSLSAQSQALRDALQARLAELGSGPTKIQGQSYEALRAARQAELGAKYGAERSKLEEELAARGLSASTIGGGRYGDLAGQQARALGTLDAELLGQQAEAEARDRAQYLNTMQQFAQTTGTQDIGTFEANVKSKEVTATINLRAAELQQQAALEGRSMDLQQARDQATSEYQMGQLALSTDELGERRRSNLAGEGFQRDELGERKRSNLATESQATLELAERRRSGLAGEQQQKDQLAEDKRRNLAGEGQSAAELAERKRSGMAGEKLQQDQLGEDKRRNEALEKVQTGELTLRQGTAVSQLISDIYSGRTSPDSWEPTLRAMGLNPADFVGLKPAAKAEDKKTEDKKTEEEKEKEKEKEKAKDPDKAEKGVGTGDGKNADGNTNYTSQPINLDTIPLNLSSYSVGQTFNYQGVLLTLRADNMLYDSNGKRFMTGE